MTQGWKTGWKEIAKYIGRSVKTAKLYHYKYSLPVKRLPGNCPAIIPYEVDLWLINFDRRKKLQKG